LGLGGVPAWAGEDVLMEGCTADFVEGDGGGGFAFAGVAYFFEGAEDVVLD